jgi:hypothetical protein
MATIVVLENKHETFSCHVMSVSAALGGALLAISPHVCRSKSENSETFL